MEVPIPLPTPLLKFNIDIEHLLETITDLDIEPTQAINAFKHWMNQHKVLIEHVSKSQTFVNNCNLMLQSPATELIGYLPVVKSNPSNRAAQIPVRIYRNSMHLGH